MSTVVTKVWIYSRCGKYDGAFHNITDRILKYFLFFLSKSEEVQVNINF